jgi:hypothetical protein
MGCNESKEKETELYVDIPDYLYTYHNKFFWHLYMKNLIETLLTPQTSGLTIIIPTNDDIIQLSGNINNLKQDLQSHIIHKYLPKKHQENFEYNEILFAYNDLCQRTEFIQFQSHMVIKNWHDKIVLLPVAESQSLNIAIWKVASRTQVISRTKIIRYDRHVLVPVRLQVVLEAPVNPIIKKPVEKSKLPVEKSKLIKIICTICMENQPDWVVVPCGHSISCNSCYSDTKDNITECPTCRGKISSCMRIHLQEE